MFDIHDSDLLMYIDGLASPEVTARIEQDETLRARVATLGREHQRWLSHLYRRDCPDSLVLGEYHLERLFAPKKKEIEKHLAYCIHCAKELAEIAAFVQDQGVEKPVKIFEQIEIIIAKFMGGNASPKTRLVGMPGMRGGDTDKYQYEAGSSKIALKVNEDSETPGFQELSGIITGMEIASYRVSLWQAGVEMGRAELDEFGGFTISNLQPGEYQLIIHGPKVEIHVQSFVV